MRATIKTAFADRNMTVEVTQTWTLRDGTRMANIVLPSGLSAHVKEWSLTPVPGTCIERMNTGLLCGLAVAFADKDGKARAGSSIAPSHFCIDHAMKRQMAADYAARGWEY